MKLGSVTCFLRGQAELAQPGAVRLAQHDEAVAVLEQAGLLAPDRPAAYTAASVSDPRQRSRTPGSVSRPRQRKQGAPSR